jgi:hypothetical protein
VLDHDMARNIELFLFKVDNGAMPQSLRVQPSNT